MLMIDYLCIYNIIKLIKKILLSYPIITYYNQLQVMILLINQLKSCILIILETI